MACRRCELVLRTRLFAMIAAGGLFSGWVELNVEVRVASSECWSVLDGTEEGFQLTIGFQCNFAPGRTGRADGDTSPRTLVLV